MTLATKADFKGVIPPLVTPFDADENIDVEALRAEIRFHLTTGVHGLCVTGSTGDGQMLSLEQSVTVARVAVEEVAGAVPVIAGIIRDSTAEVIRYGQALKETGVAALQVTPVHYLFQPDEQTTVEYYRRITEATGLPVVIYNVIPYALIPATTVYRVIQEIDLVVGVKQSGGNIHQLADLLKAAPTEGVVLTAVDDLLYPAYLLGAQGAISATLTVVPELCVAQWNAVQAGDHKTALDIHNKLLPVWRAIDGPNMTVRIKAALELQGRNGGLGAHPLTPVSDAERDAIRAALVESGVLPV
ncbi:dihydrodipicolinate synthase family protein [Dactylosporangium sucinum]|uniref:4-hydroxy-tetrahydrodipicolinate synthase n=1 Tax=Dactylosporangium sucinum TaxID=1424081 RepID=A0A917TUT3_9ACTN|nr:dihydrodipicolinate synthase family protein [Dactylosporangium sucinum]GGM36525.1 4-hydroxy-tetrahydrodipicolinate synthase [Dactylosporangium sucinum]